MRKLINYHGLCSSPFQHLKEERVSNIGIDFGGQVCTNGMQNDVRLSVSGQMESDLLSSH